MSDVKWRGPKVGEYITSRTGNAAVGGDVSQYSPAGYEWMAWSQDAFSRRERNYKTLKAAQRAVEKWLEKHR